MRCPKCKYVRLDTDTAPDYECPKCGIVYDKYDPIAEEKLDAIRAKVAIRAQKEKDAVDKKEATTASLLPKPERLENYYCNACHSYSEKAKFRGSAGVQLALYLFFFVPGIIYSVWRASGGPSVCPRCGSESLIAEISDTHVKCPDCRELVLKEAHKCKHCGCALIPQPVTTKLLDKKKKEESSKVLLLIGLLSFLVVLIYAFTR